jgi:integrase
LARSSATARPTPDLGSQPEPNTPSAEINDRSRHVRVALQIVRDRVPVRQPQDLGHLRGVYQIFGPDSGRHRTGSLRIGSSDVEFTVVNPAARPRKCAYTPGADAGTCIGGPDVSKGKRAPAPSTRARQKPLTAEDFLEEWLTSIAHAVRPRTLRRYEEYVRLHAIPAFGETALSKLSPRDVQALYTLKITDGLAPLSVLHLHRVLHRAFRQAQRWGLVEQNVVEFVDPPMPHRREMHSLSPEQASRFLFAARKDRLEALYVLAITTGMRQGELLGLRWRDVDLEQARLRVTGSLQYLPGQGLAITSPKTARSRRQVMLSSIAVQAMERRRQAQAQERTRSGKKWQDHNLVFTTYRGGPLYATNIIKRSFPSLLKAAGLPRIRFHDLRHTAATLLLGQSVHPKIVSEMLGHTTVGITLDLYSHATPTMQREATEAFDRLLGD